MKQAIVLWAFLVSFVTAGKHLNANGPFGKRHKDDDELIRRECKRPPGEASSSRIIVVASLNVSSTIYSSNELITITWSSPLTTCHDDYIGIYFAEIPITSACSYFDNEVVNNTQSSTSWRMINLRCPLEFRYFSREYNCSGNYSIIARSPVIQPRNYNEPTQIHLAYGDRADQMFVSYVTNSSQCIPQCQYGLIPSVLNFRQNGTTTTYTASDMCEGKANKWGPRTFIDPGYMHTILLEDLRPSTTYYYRVGSDEHGWSSIYSFTNRPANENETVYMIAYGDMGLAPYAPGSKFTTGRVTARVTSFNITCLLHIGDISYARGFGAQWDAFMTQIEPIAARIPYMVAIGNHEYDHVLGGDKDPSGAPGPGGFRPEWGNYAYDSGGECAVPMIHRFHSPSNGNSLFWYSFDVGPVHIIYYSTEHDFRHTSPQYAWLEQDLRSVDRSRTPWIIVGSHRPMYASETDEPYDFTKIILQLSLESLFYKYHVDVNLFAHKHSYERTCPMFQQKCVSDGITHVLIGMAGQDIDSGQYSGAAWSIYHDQEYGYSQLWANRTYLYFSYYHNSDDMIADQFTLEK
ncbi:unnamed protein product [Rotaria magnacalcarata]|uniref:Purple acid phosphatase n=1 Tax=Rotaria magnacalcarata TaxID=392030 RepID=A0A816VWQ3_9BILA|nr:unnamed protein product [Rotaria magnacalcarata]CAF4132449.1 unnamed protein product [Rotaria magnacalcarata]